MSRWALGAAAALLAFAAPADEQQVRIVSPQAAVEMVKAGIGVIVDVRERDEVKAGMAKPALWMATSAIEKDPARFGEWLQDHVGSRVAVFYCARGARARKAAVKAAALGFEAASMGTYKDWVAAGLPVRVP